MTDLAESAARLERDAISLLDETLAGAALCRVDGGLARPAKYWEGRSAALAQVRRALRRAEAGTEAELLATLRATWRRQLETQRGEAWQTYNSAGLEALAELQS